MIKKVVCLFAGVLVGLTCYGQDFPWFTKPMLISNPEISKLSASILYYPNGMTIGEVDLEKGNSGALKTPFDAFVRYFNVSTLKNFSMISVEKEKALNYPEERLTTVINQRNMGNEVFVESIIEMDVSEGERLALVKFFIITTDLPDPIFGIKVFAEKDGVWLIHLVNPIVDFSISFLSCKTSAFFDVLDKKYDEYMFYSESGMNILLFNQTINRWIEEPERYRKENDFFIQNLGWK